MLLCLESPWSLQDTKTEAEMWAVVPNVRITRKSPVSVKLRHKCLAGLVDIDQLGLCQKVEAY